MAITAAQCRAARALLRWNQQRVADAAGVAKATVMDFEREARRPTPNNLGAIQRALEAAGVAFVDENGGGCGVRFRSREAGRSAGKR